MLSARKERGTAGWRREGWETVVLALWLRAANEDHEALNMTGRFSENHCCGPLRSIMAEMWGKCDCYATEC